MSDIERARTILAEVRNGATPAGKWSVDRWAGGVGIVAANGMIISDLGATGYGDASLIVLMTNPDMLDAIDGMLAEAQNGWPVDALEDHAERIASAIVTAYEGMQR